MDAQQLVARNQELLDRALGAIRDRGYWSAYPESPSPKVYREGAAEAGRQAYEAHLGRRFVLDRRQHCWHSPWARLIPLSCTRAPRAGLTVARRPRRLTSFGGSEMVG